MSTSPLAFGRSIRSGNGVFIEREPVADPSERRSQTRCRIALALTLVGDHNFYLGVSENISEGGLFVVTYNQLDIGELVELEFSLPHRDLPCRVTGEVRWCRSPDSCHAAHNNYGGPDDGVRPGYGIQFRDVRREDEAAIREFLKARTPEFYEV